MNNARGSPAGDPTEGIRGNHGFRSRVGGLLNIASRMKLTGINQLWVADITYIRLKAEFVYLAVILDGYSRKVVG